MGKVIDVHPGQDIPGKDTDISIRMTKLVKGAGAEIAACPECEVAVTGLYWQNGSTGEFDSVADITEMYEYDYPNGYLPLHFYFHVAKLVGEACDEEIVWSLDWQQWGTPKIPPTTWTDGAYCIAHPLMSDTVRAFLYGKLGVLSISCTVAGVTYGPLKLKIEEEPG